MPTASSSSTSTEPSGLGAAVMPNESPFWAKSSVNDVGTAVRRRSRSLARPVSPAGSVASTTISPIVPEPL